MNYQEPMYHIIPSLDYLHVVCVKCKVPCEMDFKGYDPAIPLIEITCPNCGPSGKWKLFQGGHGFGKPEGSPAKSKKRG
jgi:hypothetical protein